MKRIRRLYNYWVKLGPNQRKWIRALKSGKFKQGRSRLETSDGSYCCLGVLCEISGQKLFRSSGYMQGTTLYDQLDVAEWSGIRKPSGVALEGASLTYMNDVGGFSFEDIANAILDDPRNYFSERK